LLNSQLTILDVESFIALKRKTADVRIVNGYLKTLQGAFERALEFEMIGKNIFKVVKKFKQPTNSPLYLSKDELEGIVNNEDEERYKLIYRFGAYTGMRMGEIRFLKWSSINFDKDLITVHNHEEFTTKSKKSRDVTLHISLRGDLLAIKTKPDDYIFLNAGRQYTKNQLSRNFKAAVIRAKLNNKYHFHTLGHTFASCLVQKGINIYGVSKLLGHADIKTTEIYVHLKENNLMSINGLNMFNIELAFLYGTI
jgi:integrase/recombinase XerD